jgi:hypothetical protein
MIIDHVKDRVKEDIATARKLYAKTQQFAK